jgi:hypothetical protein
LIAIKSRGLKGPRRIDCKAGLRARFFLSVVCVDVLLASGRLEPDYSLEELTNRALLTDLQLDYAYGIDTRDWASRQRVGHLIRTREAGATEDQDGQLARGVARRALRGQLRMAGTGQTDGSRRGAEFQDITTVDGRGSLRGRIARAQLL